MTNKYYRDQCRAILGMKVDTDNIGCSFDDESLFCCVCGDLIVDDLIMPIEGEFYCDYHFPEDEDNE